VWNVTDKYFFTGRKSSDTIFQGLEPITKIKLKNILIFNSWCSKLVGSHESRLIDFHGVDVHVRLANLKPAVSKESFISKFFDRLFVLRV
jgi:hypothetical protein